VSNQAEDIHRQWLAHESARSSEWYKLPNGYIHAGKQWLRISP